MRQTAAKSAFFIQAERGLMSALSPLPRGHRNKIFVQDVFG